MAPNRRTAVARAGTNIALVKYWGKRDVQLNLPRTGSLSLTLAGLETVTGVTVDPGLQHDHFELDGHIERGVPLGRVGRFLALVRERAGVTGLFARVVSRNSFPTAAGLASSASGFAALARAASAAYGVDLTAEGLSALARRGSGSAARSVFGGLVEMEAGVRPDGSDACAHQLVPPGGWPLRLVVAVTTEAAKDISSTIGMGATEQTSPLYEAWVASHAVDLEEARLAVAGQDLEVLGAVMERNCLGMHACMMAARPPLLYWNEATVAAMREVWNLRARGIPVWFTIDAGPHVKTLCRPEEATAVKAALDAVPGVARTIAAAPGEGARLESMG
ncbi:MAG: diphosphomevalonate decarboxylase [Deltaproteobacteria bacterium]|nr:diphosphomevalonate decarboxylase [Deltaproteobacteria bacterium]